MGARIAWHGSLPDDLAELPALLGDGQGAGPADMLLCAAAQAESAMRRAELYAGEPGGDDRLIVLVATRPAGRGSLEVREEAALGAWVRWAAGAWAGRRVRVNAVNSDRAPVRDVAAAIQAIARWRSMTGQIIHLRGA